MCVSHGGGFVRTSGGTLLHIITEGRMLNRGSGQLRRAHGPCALLHPREGSARVCAARGAVGGAIHALVIRGAESVYRRLESHWLRPGRSAATDASAHDITAVFLTDDASARRMP